MDLEMGNRRPHRAGAGGAEVKRKLLVVEVPHEWNLHGNWISCHELPTAEELGNVAVNEYRRTGNYRASGQAIIERLTKGKP